MNNKIHYICQNCGKEFDDDKDEKLNCPFCGAEESQISMSATFQTYRHEMPKNAFFPLHRHHTPGKSQG